MKTQTIFSGNVAGLSHRELNYASVGIGDTLLLMADPNNAYDKNAVIITHEASGQDFGFMPADSTRAFHDAVANGFPVFAKIESMNLSARYPKIVFTIVIQIP